MKNVTAYLDQIIRRKNRLGLIKKKTFPSPENNHRRLRREKVLRFPINTRYI